jgi:hypothetical protein
MRNNEDDYGFMPLEKVREFINVDTSKNSRFNKGNNPIGGWVIPVSIVVMAAVCIGSHWLWDVFIKHFCSCK